MRVHAHLPVLAAALLLSVVWDLGYGFLSLESGVALAAGLCIGVLLDLLSMRSLRARTVWLMLLFVSMLDIYFLTGVWSVRIAVVAGVYLAWRWYARMPSQALVTAAVVFALSLLLSGKPHQGASPVKLPASDSADDQFLVHLVMDELGAFDSVPLDQEKSKEVEEISAQYAKRGFVLYRNIQSVSPDTQLSMGALMDNAYLNNPEGNVQKEAGKNAYRILDNRLQQGFLQQGWRVSVVQPEYVGYCQPGFSCFTYGLEGSAGAFETMPDAGLRIQVLIREFLAALISQPRGLDFMEPFRQLILDKALPKGGWSNPTIPFVAVAQLDLIRDALIDGQGRHYVFAHVLAPHFPWVYDRRCQAKSVEHWLLPYAGRADKPPGARQQSTDAYWAQSVCVHQTLLRFIDALDAAHPGRVRFVIHGDHGPRTMARSLKDAPQFAHDDQFRKNLHSPFVATRIESDRIRPPPVDMVLQTLVFGLLSAESRVIAAGH